jgi:hypothetical protein
MTKKIFEELPARKFAPAKAAPAAAAKGTGNVEGEGSEKRIRQAVYDIRYRARREGIDLRAAYSQYMSNSNLTAPEQAAVRAKLFGKDGGGGEKKESYDATMNDGATSAVAKAMFKVFVEKNIQEEEIQEDLTSEKKYKVRVIDEKSGRSYVRYADRQKITELRAKGLKVEMTEHGDPYEGKRERKGGLDPVAKNPAKRDGDVNNDGKKDGTDKYIYNRRDAINAAIAKKKGMKEEFLADGTTSTEGQNRGKITGKNVDNYKTGVVKVMPTTESASKLQSLIAEKKKAAEVVAEEMCGKCGKAPCECPKEEDKKEISAGERRTYRELLKAKLRAMGIKNPLIMNMNPGEEETMKAMTASSAKMAATCEETEQVDENRFAAYGGKDTDPGARYAKPFKGGNKKGVYTMKGKDGKPLFPTAEETEQLDEFLGSDAQKAVDTFTKNLQRKIGVRKDKPTETKGETPVTSGGGTPDTQKADKETERLGKNRMRQAGY